MKRVNVLILLLLLCGGISRMQADAPTHGALNRLDEVMAGKTFCQERREDSIRVLKLRLTRAEDDMERYELCNSLFEI